MARILLVGLAVLISACGSESGNPFAATSPSRPPGADAAILFVTGSWSAQAGAPREVFAIAADGSNPQQLTTCGRAAQPCDILQVAPSPDRSRVIAVRTTPDAEPGAQFLYFMDLGRSVEQVIFARRRVDSADWSQDGTFILFASPNIQSSNEDLFTSQPDGREEQNLTESLDVRESHARLDPFGRTAVFERACSVAGETCPYPGVSRIYLFAQTALTSGPATGPALPGTPYVVGSDADPAFSPEGTQILFRRLTGTGNGGLGTWDLLAMTGTANSTPRTLASGPVYRGAADWGREGIVFVETDAQAGRSQLVVIQADGSGRRVLRSENSGFRMGAPRWLD